jgi:hypothetical protein
LTGRQPKPIVRVKSWFPDEADPEFTEEEELLLPDAEAELSPEAEPELVLAEFPAFCESELDVEFSIQNKSCFIEKSLPRPDALKMARRIRPVF